MHAGMAGVAGNPSVSFRIGTGHPPLPSLPSARQTLWVMDEQTMIREKFEALAPMMDERMTRLWVAAEARALGRGGPALVGRATGVGRNRIRAGIHDLED